MTKRSSFIMPSIIDPLALMVPSPSGKARNAARLLRGKLEALLPQHLGAVATFAGSLRGSDQTRFAPPWASSAASGNGCSGRIGSVSATWIAPLPAMADNPVCRRKPERWRGRCWSVPALAIGPHPAPCARSQQAGGGGL